MAGSPDVQVHSPSEVRSSDTSHTSGLARKAAIAISFTLLALYAIGWWGAIQSNQGTEQLVRWTDFKSTLTGALVIHDGNGQHLYDLSTQLNAQNRVLAPYIHPIAIDSLLPYNHLPFEALLVAPLVGLPYTLIFGLWTLLMAVAFGLSLRVMYRSLPISGYYLPLFVLAACSYQPVFRSFILGQNSPLVLLGLCSLYAFSRKANDMWAGASLLLVALKPQILPVVLLFLLLRGRWKTLAAFAVMLVVLCVALMPVLGPGWILDYAKLLLGVANWGNAGAIDPAIMHNWRGFATNLFSGWAPSLATPVFALLTLVSVGLLVYTWYRVFRRHDAASGRPVVGDNTESYDLTWALVAVIAALTSLHLNPHDLTLLVFPGWVLGAYAVSGHWDTSLSRFWLWVLWADYTLIPLTFFLMPQDNPALQTIPDILIMALAAAQLARQLATRAHSLGLPLRTAG